MNSGLILVCNIAFLYNCIILVYSLSTNEVYHFRYHKLSDTSTLQYSDHTALCINDNFGISRLNFYCCERSTKLHASSKDVQEDMLSEYKTSENSCASHLVKICDEIDQYQSHNNHIMNYWLRYRRYNILTKLLQKDREEYLTIVNFLQSRIPRQELPNVQGVKPLIPQNSRGTAPIYANEEGNLVDDCEIPKAEFKESLLDKILLSIFRSFVRTEINYSSPKEGILGLLDEGIYLRRLDEQSGGNGTYQHEAVKRVLMKLLTPIVPPFYRTFMGSRFYSPFLTTLVLPPFLSFLVGPSRMNRRKDGQFGGLIVERCKFLQESNCKGLCLHQCKIPAQDLFAQTLNIPLTVTPNFETQECQWSWGETPLPHSQDPEFPKGCIRGCDMRLTIGSSLGYIES